MKRTTITILAVIFAISAFPQRSRTIAGWKISRDIPKNELKLNLGTTIFALFPEISYERLLDSDISIGAALGVGLNDDEQFINSINYGFTPYVRWFFGGSYETLQKYSAGFFIEANGGVFIRQIYDYNYENHEFNSWTYTGPGAGLGLAVGWKYVTHNNWVGELYLGGGRDFINDDGYPRMGVSIGKRF